MALINDILLIEQSYRSKVFNERRIFTFADEKILGFLIYCYANN